MRHERLRLSCSWPRLRRHTSIAYHAARAAAPAARQSTAAPDAPRAHRPAAAATTTHTAGQRAPERPATAAHAIQPAAVHMQAALRGAAGGGRRRG